MLDDLSIEWMKAKEDERLAVEKRRQIEDKMLSLIGIPDNLDGTETANTGAFKIKVVGRLNRKVDGDVLQEVARENGLEAHLSSLFRWKPEINLTIWKAADKSITGPLLAAITTTPGRPSFTITKE